MEEPQNKQVHERGFDVIDQLLTRAKLDPVNDLKPLVQDIYFGDSIASDDLKLFEVEQSMLDYLLEGNSLVIRGDATENAVCCTKNATYSFKIAEISNPLLLTTNINFPETIDESRPREIQKSNVFFMTNSYFTMSQDKPRLHKLKNLLEMNLYFGKAIDQNSESKKYGIKDLLEIIQSSEEEIYNYLNYIEAFQIDGYWRLLEFGYFNKLLDDILKVIDDNSMSYELVSVEEIYSDLQGIYSLSILRQMMNYFFTQNPDDCELYAIKKEKIICFYAESLLRSTLKMNYNEFLAILRRSLPNALKFDFNPKYIQSICYIEEPYIYYLNMLDLPDEIEKRFKVLFEKRKKWTSDELSAFIKDLCSHNTTEINNALTKYCRPFNHNGIRYYTSRI